MKTTIHAKGTTDWRLRYPQHLVDRLEWFQDLKLGVVFHWGIYSRMCLAWVHASLAGGMR